MLSGSSVPSDTARRVARYLVSGGDSRLALDPDSGLSRYRCAPWPRDVLPMGSCTASSPSALGFDAATEALEQRGRLSDLFGRVRREVGDLLLGAQARTVDIALAPSGTDAEYLALLLALDGERDLVNILVGPREVGSGTPLAAAFRHFDAFTPSGERVLAGDPVDPLITERVTVREVVLREAGAPRPPEAIDADVERHVAEAVAGGRRALLHIVAHSKTGVHAPTLATALALQQRWPDLVTVMVDAAQGRFSRRGLAEVLAAGFLVMTTGSKFFGGPPFSGMLLVPERHRPTVPMPSGLAAYFSRDLLPPAWEAWRATLPPSTNVGLALRHAAALAEIRAYYEATPGGRLAVLRAWEHLVPAVLGDTLDLLPVSPPLLDDGKNRLLESKTTVYPFLSDIPPTTILDRLDARGFHLGQPVALGPDGPRAPRVALGAVLIRQWAAETNPGAAVEHALVSLRDAIEDVRRETT